MTDPKFTGFDGAPCNDGRTEPLQIVEHWFSNHKQDAGEHPLILANDPSLDNMHGDDEQNKVLWVLVNAGITCGDKSFKVHQENGSILGPWLETYGQAQLAVAFVRTLKCSFKSSDWLQLALRSCVETCPADASNCTSCAKAEGIEIPISDNLKAEGIEIPISDKYSLSTGSTVKVDVSQTEVPPAVPWQTHVKVPPLPIRRQCVKTGLPAPNDEVCYKNPILLMQDDTEGSLDQDTIRRIFWLKQAGADIGFDIIPTRYAKMAFNYTTQTLNIKLDEKAKIGFLTRIWRTMTAASNNEAVFTVTCNTESPTLIRQ